MKIITKILFSLSVFIFCLTLADISLFYIYFSDNKGQFANAETNIFAEENCIANDLTTGYKPIWGKCGYPDLDNIKSKSKNANILGITNTKNILILGDSNSDWSSYDLILEDKLNKNNVITNYKFNVINMAVAGYNTLQEANLFFNEAQDIDLQMLILQFSLTDFEFSPVIISNNKSISLIDANGKVSAPNQILYKSSAIYKLALLTNLKLEYNPSEESLRAENIKNAIRKLQNYASLHKIQFLVVIYPIFNEEFDNLNRKTITAILEGLKINYIDLATNIKFKQNPEKYALSTQNGKDFQHSNRLFDPIVAQEIFSKIKSVN